ncbi:phenylalanine--tRNA ligase beta subunit-related protein [Streptomyces sp. NPDC001674]|uniref:B3/B4 domain-containing protein n=1 Tax=Streptomyces sp. NPDC001674 TaxID=3154394 RepID=UPI00332D2A52
MPAVSVDETLYAQFPGARIALVVACDVRGAELRPQGETALAGLEAETSAGTFVPADENNPAISSWHAAYRRFGTNPRRFRPSVDALCRRLTRSGQLPRINGPVDLYNSISVRHALPAGAFDMDALRGDLTVRFARPGDEFVPLGEPDTVETPRYGEVVYADEISVVSRHWNHRDSDRSKVTDKSRNIIFIFETVLGSKGAEQLQVAAGQLSAGLATYADRTTTYLLGPGGLSASW